MVLTSTGFDSPRGVIYPVLPARCDTGGVLCLGLSAGSGGPPYTLRANPLLVAWAADPVPCFVASLFILLMVSFEV